MPNWVRTQVKIEGPEFQIAIVRGMARLTEITDKGFFSQFAPMPEGLEAIRVYSDIYDMQKAKNDEELLRVFGNNILKLIRKTEEEIKELKAENASYSYDYFWEMFANLAHACRFKQETGHSSWYSWACENWGTKWDISFSDDSFGILYDSPESITLLWDTAWGLAAPALEKLFTFLDGKCSISGEFADEDIGNNCGTFFIENGKCKIEYPEDPVQFSLDLWGWDREEWEAEQN